MARIAIERHPHRAMRRAIALPLAAALLCLLPSTGDAYERYNDGCQGCHGHFWGAESPKGTQFPADSKHEMHRSSAQMATDCALCHLSGEFQNPFIGASAGTSSNPGAGCTGCHGRDYGGSIGNSGVGLRAHHTAIGIPFCVSCHDDDPAPLPENVLPTYYGTADTRADDPCNTAPGFLENWSIGDTEGLDNDGDDAYDTADIDCGACPDLDGDGVVGFGDLLVMLAAWGDCPGCPADLDGDGTVGFADLLQILAFWGACPGGSA